MMPLLLGTVLAVAALAFVLYPIFRTSFFGDVGPIHQDRGADTAQSQKQTAVDALREIEFDRATGKLSEDDYATLRARYTSAAVTEMRNSDAAVAVSSEEGRDAASLDAAEALITRFRAQATTACSTCGPRPEPDALYCSNCGRFLPGACGHCGARVSEPGAQYCSSCGARLAA